MFILEYINKWNIIQKPLEKRKILNLYGTPTIPFKPDWKQSVQMRGNLSKMIHLLSNFYKIWLCISEDLNTESLVLDFSNQVMAAQLAEYTRNTYFWLWLLYTCRCYTVLILTNHFNQYGKVYTINTSNRLFKLATRVVLRVQGVNEMHDCNVIRDTFDWIHVYKSEQKTNHMRYRWEHGRHTQPASSVYPLPHLWVHIPLFLPCESSPSAVHVLYLLSAVSNKDI